MQINLTKETKMKIAYGFIGLVALIFAASTIVSANYQSYPIPTPVPTPACNTQPTPTPTPHHYTCREQSCVLVVGGGDNSCNPQSEDSCKPASTPTPIPSPTSTPIPSPSPDVTPSPSPSTPSDSGGSSSSDNAPSAPVCQTINAAPTVTEFKVNNQPLSIHVSWSKSDSFVQDYEVWYGITPRADNWNVIVKGDNQTDLNYLPTGSSIWVKVRGLANGCAGPFGLAQDPWPKQF